MLHYGSVKMCVLEYMIMEFLRPMYAKIKPELALNTKRTCINSYYIYLYSTLSILIQQILGNMY